jgi:DNA-binding transcriptional ArsR family regulator
VVNAESVFRALGDTTRYAIASMLARTPTTSAELARSLKVSKPTITHHVQTLRAAGLIEEESDRGSNRLSLNRETVAALSDAAVEHFFSSTGDLALVTTRKRKSEL